MSWQVRVIKNTLVGNFDQKLVLEFKEALQRRGSFDEGEDWEPLYNVSPGCYAPTFNTDHGEYLDYLVNDDIRKIFTKAGVSGVVAFAQLDGDDGPMIWSYTFQPGRRVVIRRKNMIDCM